MRTNENSNAAAAQAAAREAAARAAREAAERAAREAAERAAREAAERAAREAAKQQARTELPKPLEKPVETINFAERNGIKPDALKEHFNSKSFKPSLNNSLFSDFDNQSAPPSAQASTGSQPPRVLPEQTIGDNLRNSFRNLADKTDKNSFLGKTFEFVNKNIDKAQLAMVNADPNSILGRTTSGARDLWRTLNTPSENKPPAINPRTAHLMNLLPAQDINTRNISATPLTATTAETDKLSPNDALDQINQLPISNINDPAAIRAYNRQRAEIADEALGNAAPPQREDFASLNGRTAEYEFREAKTSYDGQVRELQNVSNAAKTRPAELPLNAFLTPNQAVERIRQLPVPSPTDAAATQEYQRQRATIADSAVQSAVPPTRDDYKGIPPQVAAAEYGDALSSYNNDISQLKSISRAAKVELQPALGRDPKVTPFPASELYSNPDILYPRDGLSPEVAARAVLGSENSPDHQRDFLLRFAQDNEDNPQNLREFYQNLGTEATGKVLNKIINNTPSNTDLNGVLQPVIKSFNTLAANGKLNQTDMNNLVRSVVSSASPPELGGVRAAGIFAGDNSSPAVKQMFAKAAVSQSIALNNPYLAAVSTNTLAQAPPTSLPEYFQGMKDQEVQKFFELPAKGQQQSLPLTDIHQNVLTSENIVGNTAGVLNNLTDVNNPLQPKDQKRLDAIRTAAYRGVADGLAETVYSEPVMKNLSGATRDAMRQFYLEDDRLLTSGELVAVYTDPGERNRFVTEQYRQLSNEMAELVGKDNANWATFGVWASDEAGRAIRGEGFPTNVANATFKPNEDLSRGNTAVFSEIGPVFRHFIDTYKANPNASFNDFWKTTNLPETHSLRPAFEAYHEAMKLKQTGGDPDKRAEYMLLGNALVGVHEQKQLQKPIEDALRTGVVNPLGAAGPWLNLHLPNKKYDLDLDLIGNYPSQLNQISNADLAALVSQFGGLENTGNKHWEVYDQRMQYIFNLFRLNQQDPSLFQNPRDVFKN